MNKATIILKMALIVIVAGCVTSCQSDDETVSTATSPTNSCTDYSTPAVPSGATTVPLLIIRIQFAGELYDSQYRGDPFAFNHFQSDACTWAKKIFNNTNEGELNHYFNQVSNNKFHIIPAIESYDNGDAHDGIITVTLTGNHPDPGSNGYFHQKLVDALTLADPYIDFSSFDVSGDGVLHQSDLQVMFLVAGYESATGMSPGVWAHRWYIISGAEGVETPILDNVPVCGLDNGYSRFGERQMYDGHDATIGVIAHELGHAVWNLPDLYDTDGSSAGIGYFGLMGGGSWTRENGEYSGETPVHPTAWTKNTIGWYSPSNQVAGTYTLYATGDASYNMIKVDISTDTNEFFLIENRGSTGYDKGLYSLSDIAATSTFQGGIAIWHIDENSYTNSNDAYRIVDLEEATDPGLDSNNHPGKSTGLFWGSYTVFNNTSSPNSQDNDGNITGVDISTDSVRNISMDIIVN